MKQDDVLWSKADILRFESRRSSRETEMPADAPPLRPVAKPQPRRLPAGWPIEYDPKNEKHGCCDPPPDLEKRP